MKDSLHTILYAAVLAVVSAGLLTAAAKFTEPYAKANAEAERMRNILAVLAVPFDAGASSRELVAIFETNVQEEEQDDLKLYVYRPDGADGAVAAVAIAFEGSGLWGPIEGLLSLEADRRTIRGVTFYRQEETPGLGGEIVAAWFRNQFAGKSIYSAAGKPGIGIRRTRGKGPNEVDAITGATMTCEKVEAMLNEAIRKIAREDSKNG